MTKHALWGGPHDGLEVNIPIGYVQHIESYRVGLPGSEQNLQAQYLLNTTTQRFEWEAFL